MQYKVIKDNAVAYKSILPRFVNATIDFTQIDLIPILEVQPIDFNPINIIFNGTKEVGKLNGQQVNVICGFITNPIIPGTLPQQYDIEACFLESDVQAINAVKIAGYNFSFTTVLVFMGLCFIAYKLFKKK